MKVSNGVLIITVVNCYEPLGRASVWVVVESDEVDGRRLPPEHLQNAILIIGPVDDELAIRVAENLERLMVSLGIPYQKDTIPDD